MRAISAAQVASRPASEAAPSSAPLTEAAEQFSRQAAVAREPEPLVAVVAARERESLAAEAAPAVEQQAEVVAPAGAFAPVVAAAESAA
jgi:hypothetical protein